MSSTVLTQTVTPTEQTNRQLQYTVLMGSATQASGSAPANGVKIILPDGTPWLVTGQAITDTSTHYSGFYHLGTTPQRSIFAYSNLDQAVTLQVFGSVDGQLVGGAGTQFVNSYTITGGSNQPANIVVPASAGWVIVGTLSDIHFNVLLSATASAAPTSGALILLVVEES